MAYMWISRLTLAVTVNLDEVQSMAAHGFTLAGGAYQSIGRDGMASKCTELASACEAGLLYDVDNERFQVLLRRS